MLHKLWKDYSASTEIKEGKTEMILSQREKSAKNKVKGGMTRQLFGLFNVNSMNSADALEFLLYVEKVFCCE
jgi:hypothetical protein